jgi:hypothetical protein
MQMNTKTYYVYQWKNIETGEIIYVGKGIGGRYRLKAGRNKAFNDYTSKFECMSEIIVECISEEDALQIEHELINEYKPCCNLYSRKSGLSNVTKEQIDRMKNDNPMKSQVQRDRMSKDNPMYDQKQKERMSKNNPMKDPEIAAKQARKLGKPILIGEEWFWSIKEAARTYGIYEQTVHYWLKVGKTGKKFGHLPCRYDNQQPSNENFQSSIIEGSTTNW